MEYMEYNETIIQELRDCKAGEQICVTFTDEAMAAIMPEAEYRRWEQEGGYFITLPSDYETDSEIRCIIPADGNYYLYIESTDECPKAELKSLNRIPADPFIFNETHTDKKIVRRLADDAPTCTIATWQRKTGIELRDPYVCWYCNTVRPASTFRCVPVKIASMFQSETYSVPLCPCCQKKAEGSSFMVSVKALAPSMHTSPPFHQRIKRRH